MKKIISKIRNILTATGIFLITSTKNVFGVEYLIGGELTQPDYGVYDYEPSKKSMLMAILKKSFYPLIFVIISVIGLIMTLKRNKKSKASVIEMLLLIIFTLYFGTYFIAKEYSFKLNKELIWIITKAFYIPFLFIIGSIIYLNKSNSSKIKKVLTLLILLLLVITTCLGINYILQK